MRGDFDDADRKVSIVVLDKWMAEVSGVRLKALQVAVDAIEREADYIEIATRRIASIAPLFTETA